MSEIVSRPNKMTKIVPVRLIGRKLVKVNDIPGIESKLLDSSSFLSTEPSKRQITNSSNREGLDVLINNLSQKYKELNEDIQTKKEMVGTVEENTGSYYDFDPFNPPADLVTKINFSKTKRVLFKKKENNAVVKKKFESNLFLRIYNKEQPKIRVFKKFEIDRIIKIQNKFKGLYDRKVKRGVDRLKAADCLLETILLLIERAYNNAIKKITLKTLMESFPKESINEEFQFEDKLQLKLANKFYNINNFKNLDLTKIHSKKKIKATEPDV